MNRTDDESRTVWGAPMLGHEEVSIETSAGPVKRVRHSWGDIYRGTAPALVAAGVVAANQFPGARGTRKTVAYFAIPDEPGGQITVRKRSPRQFDVYVRFGGERLRTRQEQEVAEHALREAERNVAWIPKSAARYRQMALMWVETSLRQQEMLATLGVGYRFSEETLLEFEEALEDARRVLRAGTIVFDRAERDRYVLKSRHDAAAGDAGFRRMLEGLTSSDVPIEADDGEDAS